MNVFYFFPHPFHGGQFLLLLLRGFIPVALALLEQLGFLVLLLIVIHDIPFDVIALVLNILEIILN